MIIYGDETALYWHWLHNKSFTGPHNYDGGGGGGGGLCPEVVVDPHTNMDW